MIVSQLADLLEGELRGGDSALVYGFATDHREVSAGDAFLAIKGAHFDGHELVPDAFRNGAVVAVVEREVEGPHILVPNLVDALARFASTLREHFDGPVIGITGSAGKTTTKEFVASGLQPLGKILKTAANRNTEYTAPLVWGDLDTDTKAVVVEMGMRGFNQITHLASFVQPNIGVVTNVGYGHLEMVGSRAGIAQAKGELLQALPDQGTAVIWREDDFYDSLRESAGSADVKTFGFSEDADCRVLNFAADTGQYSEVTGVCEGIPWTATVPVIGKHGALNAAAAVLVCFLAGVAPAEAAAQMGSAEIPPMRMEMREFNGAQVLLDAYNASPPAVLAAIEALENLEATGRRCAVLGEMKELGEHSESLHREVGRALGSLDSVLFYGKPMVAFARPEALSAGLTEAPIAESIHDVREYLSRLKSGDAVLIKGSRALALERALEVDES